MSTTLLYGLLVQTDFDLHDSGVVADGEADVLIHQGHTFRDWRPQPVGEVMLSFATTEPWYTLVRLDDGQLHYRVHNIGDFVISNDARHVSMHLHKDVAPGMAAIMTTGTLMSLLLFLRGQSVFHGSAVAVDGLAIGFVGHSGQGKTTMATLFCSEGAGAVTDDVLIFDGLAGAPTVRLGSRELRLRPGTSDLVARMEGVATRFSADDRQIVAAKSAEQPRIPLQAILVPLPTRDGSPLRFDRMKGARGALTLARYPRLMGWRDHGVIARFVTDAATLASQVPVLAARIPWGPPFPEGITEVLQETLAR